MAEKIKIDAVLCALPNEWIYMIRAVLRNKASVAHLSPLLMRYEDVETMDTHNRDEMLALLQSHIFRGMVTVSSWLPKDEVMARTGRSEAASILDIPTIILVEPQHYKYIPGSLTGPDYKINHDWIDIPFDIEEVILRLGSLGILPKK